MSYSLWQLIRYMLGLGTWGYTEERGEEGWDVLDQLGPHTKVEDGLEVGTDQYDEFYA